MSSIVNGAVLSCLIMSLMSNSMILMNRYLVGGKYFGFEEKTAVVFVQALVAVVILEGLKGQKLIEYEPFDMQIAKKWTPVTFFFVAMIYTSTLATASLPIHIITVFKNVTNIFIVYGEWHYFGSSVNSLVVAAILIMLGGAFMASKYDVESHGKESSLLGYVWMLLNCLCTTGYVLYMRFATSGNDFKISRFGMAYYNNLICMVLIFPVMIANGELFTVFSSPLLGNTNFLFLLIISGAFGIGLNLAAFWCVSMTSATTYAVIGGLNKLPTAFVGVFFFGEEMAPTTAVFVTFGMFGGLLFAYAKFQERKEANAAKLAAATKAMNMEDGQTLLSKEIES